MKTTGSSPTMTVPTRANSVPPIPPPSAAPPIAPRITRSNSPVIVVYLPEWNFVSDRGMMRPATLQIRDARPAPTLPSPKGGGKSWLGFFETESGAAHREDAHPGIDELGAEPAHLYIDD